MTVISVEPHSKENNVEVKPLGKDGKPWPQTIDAKLWADEFVQRNPASNHPVMLGWFANAIMAGFDSTTEKVCCGDFETCQKPCLPLAMYWKEKSNA